MSAAAELSDPAVAADQRWLAREINNGGVLVLSGAGLSTESGIPDYRGPTGRLHPATPMTFQEFTASPAARRRYWARSHRGWQRIEQAEPNHGHQAVARLQRAGLLSGVITQNVDGLHQAAGARDVIELHGGLNRVTCLSCRATSDRDELDERLVAANPGAREALDAGPVKPDGDVELAESEIASFRLVDCLDCGAGPLKPDVVFFGENVPPERVARCYALVEASRLLLVLGSSLTVASGFRFVRRAAARGIAVAIINQGATRGDSLADVLLDGPLGAVLPALAAEAIGG
ncbi:NAD-dependent protein deacetylase [Jatrophihabitans sp.]|uniref:NAD-dependent protein deacetylase n=1 Tax=Jatrophihabitans sp. TaxID=1932789 RepID=UPI002C79BD2C|nr:NAD-dependent protein deacetylase [Jatrophihabitans sp.]